MREACRDALRINFSRKLKPEFQGVNITCNDVLLAYRELDEVPKLTSMTEPELTDNQIVKNTQHGPGVQLQQ